MKLPFLIICTLSLLISYPCCGVSITPSTPTQVGAGHTIPELQTSTVQVSPSGSILVIWQDQYTQDILGAISSDKGISWTPFPYEIVNKISAGYPYLAANEQGFVLTWTNADTNYPYTTFYNTESNSWELPTPISQSLTVSGGGPILASNTPAGFILGFTDSGSGYGYVSLSSDGISWSNPIQITPTASSPSAISCAANSHLFLATWANPSSGAIYAVTSANGIDWSGGSSPITSGTLSTDHTGTSFCFGNSQGFLIVYADSGANIWSIFSMDGINWSTPSLVCPNSNPAGSGGAYYLTISVSGNDSGFIITWVSGSGGVFSAFSSNGLSWSNPIQVAPPGSQANGIYFFGSTVSVSKDLCAFTWPNSASASSAQQDPFISLSSFPYVGPIPPTPSTTSLQEKGWGLNAPANARRPGKPLN